MYWKSLKLWKVSMFIPASWVPQMNYYNPYSRCWVQDLNVNLISSYKGCLTKGNINVYRRLVYNSISWYYLQVAGLMRLALLHRAGWMVVPCSDSNITEHLLILMTSYSHRMGDWLRQALPEFQVARGILPFYLEPVFYGCVCCFKPKNQNRLTVESAKNELSLFSIFNS